MLLNFLWVYSYSYVWCEKYLTQPIRKRLTGIDMGYILAE